MSENNMDFGGISSLLQNPEIAAKLPRIMEAIAPVMAEINAEKKGETASTSQDGEKKSEGDAGADLSAITSLLSGKKSGATSRRCTLLRALEPYLSDNRKEAMEYILKVSSLIDILSEVM